MAIKVVVDIRETERVARVAPPSLQGARSPSASTSLCLIFTTSRRSSTNPLCGEESKIFSGITLTSRHWPVLGNKCIHMRCVALIDPSPPVNIGDGDSEAEQSQPKLYFKVASKTFFFHFSRFLLVVRVLGLALRD